MTNETTASQPKSIGDDVRYRSLMDRVIVGVKSAYTPSGIDHMETAITALTDYIDSRAPAAQASATIQAAPDERERFEQFLRGEWKKNLMRGEDEIRPARFGFGRDGLPVATYWHRETERAWLAWQARATIQEPVMVAEPVGKRVTLEELRAVICEDGKVGNYLALSIAEKVLKMLPATPMVADPAGVVLPCNYVEDGDRYEVFQRCTVCSDIRYGGVKTKCESVLAHLAKVNLADTVKAVPSEALAAIHGLIAVAGASYHLMDNTEESGPRRQAVFRHQADDNMRLSEALDQLDALPDDQPGYVMGPRAKAEWALRHILAAPLADKTGGGA